MYKVGTKYYNYMQQCFDGAIVFNLNEDNLKMATFLKASVAKHNPRPGWTFDGAARDMVDEIAGVLEH